MEELKITELKQGVKDGNRVNVYVNGRFAFSLSVKQVVDFEIKVGRVISEEELEKFKKESEFGKLYQRTLEWVFSRPHSEKETREYLWRKLVGRKKTTDEIHEIIARVVEKMKSMGYLDDQRFSEWYVENRFVKKGVSARRLKMELAKKGVSKDIIEEVLKSTDRNDEEEILKIIAKKRARYDDRGLIQYLCRQGFRYDLVLEEVSQFSEKD